MGAEIAIGALLGGALAAVAKPGKPPKPKAPPEAQVPNTAAKQKQKATGAYGSVDTALTGPGGLGAVKAGNKGYASVLGPAA